MADKGTLGTGLYFDDLVVGDTFRTMQRRTSRPTSQRS
jgi:hypothetical protein